MLHDILLVEDDPALRELIHIHLTRQLPEVHVRWVGTLSGALAAVGRLPPPQLILLDLTLPDATGLQALDAMARAGPCPSLPIPIIIISALGEDQRLRILSAGAAEFIPKYAGIDLERALAKTIAETWARHCYRKQLWRAIQHEGL